MKAFIFIFMVFGSLFASDFRTEAIKTVLDRAVKEAHKEVVRGNSLSAVKIINNAVVNTIAYKHDRDNYGVSDYWASEKEIISHASGDCEDLAIIKYELLKKAGVKNISFKLVQLPGQKHMVLSFDDIYVIDTVVIPADKYPFPLVKDISISTIEEGIEASKKGDSFFFVIQNIKLIFS